MSISGRIRFISLVGVPLALCVGGLLSACQAPPEPVSEPAAKAEAVPLAKPHRKLGPVLTSLNRQGTLIAEARAAGLKPTREGLLVQVAFEGDANRVESSLTDLGLTVLHRYPRYHRLDVIVRDFSELDAITGLGSVFRVQAMQTAISR